MCSLPNTGCHDVVLYSSPINDGVPFIIDVLGFILNAPNCRLFGTVGLTVPLYSPTTLSQIALLVEEETGEREEQEKGKEKYEIKNTEKTEILYGADNIVNRTIGDFHTINERFDNCTDCTGPSVFFNTPIWNEFVQLKNRGVKLRFITEITKDNVNYSKELSKVAELRHLDGVKGNFAIADASRYYGGSASVKKGESAIELIRSNVKTFVEQQQYLFETLWNKAMPAQQKIKEIEEGIPPIRTRILESQDEIIGEIKNLNDNADHLSICSGLGGMQMSYNFFLDTYRNMVYRFGKKEEQKESNKLRWIININKYSVRLVKIFLELGFEIRHVKNVLPINFGVSDKEVALTIEKMEGGKMSSSFLISNEPLYVNHFNSLFEESWKNGIDAADRIKNIEEGIESTNIEIFENPEESIKIASDIIKSAKDEVLTIYPSINAFRRQMRIGALHLFREVLEHGIRVRILIPAEEQEITQIVNEVTLALPQLNIRGIHKSWRTQMGIVVVDRKESLTIESRDDTTDNYYDAAGLAAYSNSKPIALSYASIFENLWIQTELYEQLKIHDRMQNEFINIAAHELRTPIQPILSLAELAYSKTKVEDAELSQLLQVIFRNAKRLHRLTEDILDVTKIESQSLYLNKEQFNLNDIVTTAIEDIMTNRLSSSSKAKHHAIKLLHHQPQDVFIYADKGRISQVISNLLDNAVKFTKVGGTIIVVVENKEGEGHNNNQQVLVRIKDTGTGIDSQIMPRLFTKFAAKSETGTGLGLFISKGIVEAHGGRIWAENNKDGRGATFAFSLPIS
jgi:signal transduction histidine kinase